MKFTTGSIYDEQVEDKPEPDRGPPLMVEGRIVLTFATEKPVRFEDIVGDKYSEDKYQALGLEGLEAYAVAVHEDFGDPSLYDIVNAAIEWWHATAEVEVTVTQVEEEATYDGS